MPFIGDMRVCLAAFRAENPVRTNSKGGVISRYVTGNISGNKDIRGLNGAFLSSIRLIKNPLHFADIFHFFKLISQFFVV